MPCSNVAPEPRRAAGTALLALLLAGCAAEPAPRARLLGAEVVGRGEGRALEVTQELRFSRSMRDALDAGIPLRLNYRVDGCGWVIGAGFELRYSPLNRHFELQRDDEPRARRFARRSALLAALDRVRLPLGQLPEGSCEGRVAMALDLTRLPTPLRIPAFFLPEEWRMISSPRPWSNPPSRA